MKNLSAFFSDHRRLALVIVLASAGALAFAYISQYVFNLQPCILCHYQRKPYFVVIALGLLAAGTAGMCRKTTLALLIGCGLAFLAGLGLSGFHVGVEQEWWKGLQACGDSNLPQNATIEELREYLLNRPIVRCDVPGWQMFGISMTGYNFLLSLFLTGFTFWFIPKGWKK